MVDITTVPGKYGPNDRKVLADGKAWTCSEKAKHNSEIWHNENRRFNKRHHLGAALNIAYEFICFKYDIFPDPIEMRYSRHPTLAKMQKEVEDTALSLKKRYPYLRYLPKIN